jgi:murein DD-endopeptidase MepM/ murein hydrolase activator NlpD
MKRLLIAAFIALLALGPGTLLVGAAVLMPACPVSAGSGVPGDPTIPETTRIVMPVPAGSYTISSGFGMREDPIRPWLTRMHWGTDFAAADGTPIVAVADGRVTVAGMIAGQGQITLEHTVGGERVATVYLHMWADGIYVSPGQSVVAGQIIGAVGSSGYSTGAHLHLEVRPGGGSATAVDALVWLTDHHAEGIDIDDASRCPTAPTPQPTPTDSANPIAVGGRRDLP